MTSPSLQVCCSVLQCDVVCCSVLQCVAVCYSVLQCVDAYHSANFFVEVICVAAHCNTDRKEDCESLHWIHLCCSTLQHKRAATQTCGSTLQHRCTRRLRIALLNSFALQHTATQTCGSTLQHRCVAAHCNTDVLQHTATQMCCSTLQHRWKRSVLYRMHLCGFLSRSIVLSLDGYCSTVQGSSLYYRTSL